MYIIHLYNVEVSVSIRKKKLEMYNEMNVEENTRYIGASVLLRPVYRSLCILSLFNYTYNFDGER